MRGAILALATAATLLGGCVYDPYSGTLAPCCGPYGSPYGYRYPPAYPPNGYAGPYGAPQGGQPYGAQQPGGYPQQPTPYQQQGSYQQPGAYQQQPLPYPQPGGYQQPGSYQQPGDYPQPGGYQQSGSTQQPGAYPGPQSLAPPAASSDPLASDFAAANVRRDGRLTREQAAQGMPWVAENFAAIDLDQKGYVTLSEVRTFVERQRAAGGQTGQYTAN
jgi:hypothetical protein